MKLRFFYKLTYLLNNCKVTVFISTNTFSDVDIFLLLVGVWLYILASKKYCFLQKSNCSEEAPRSGERNVNIL